MEGFNKEEWMEEMGVRESKAWKVFRIPVRLEYCDIRLKDGREVGPCWPRIQKSSDFLYLGDEETAYGFGDVTHIRYYEEGRVEKEEEEDDDDEDD